MSVPFIRQGYHPKDDDYYVILDVDFHAPPETITAAYRNLARKYHPDKNNQDERSRREAEVIFQKIKTAYDVLSDPHKRQIYDTLGPDGLKLDAWKLERKQMTAEEIREEFFRLQKQEIEDKNAIIAKPRASFTMALDASEIFRKKSKLDDEEDIDDGNDDDDDQYIGTSAASSLANALTSIEIRSLSTSMAIENNLAINHTLNLAGNLNTQNGIGDGMLSAIYRYKYSRNTLFSLLYQVGRGPIISAGVEHKFNEKTSIACRGMLKVDTYTLAPAVRISLAHQIRDYLYGKVTYREGINSSVSTSLIYHNQLLALQVTTTYKLSQLEHTLSVDMGYRFNKDKSMLHVSLVGSSETGLAVEYGCETRVFSINAIGASISLSLPSGVSLKLRYNRANQEFNIPIYLSDEIDSGPIFYGTMVPLIAYYLVDRCYLKHYKQVR